VTPIVKQISRKSMENAVKQSAPPGTEEANLMAVFSLPQGVFVSKSGVGPKTSILLFEKGKPTERVWFYQVENDGYTMGTNRTPIAGCQLPEALNIFHQYVKHGKKPPETRNSFSIDVALLKTLDPRIKEKIRNETREKLTIKRVEAQKKLTEKLDEKLDKANKAQPNTKAAQFDEAAYKDALWKFDTTWDNRIRNEIAKNIEKAHTYNFNPANYRSTLAESQLQDWDELIHHHQPESNGHSLDKRYDLLRRSALENAMNHIVNFDLKNAIEADIVREYVASIEEHERQKYPVLAKIDAIFKRGAKYPLVGLKNYLILNTKVSRTITKMMLQVKEKFFLISLKQRD